MKSQRFRPVGLVALSYSLVLLSVTLTGSTAQTGCIPSFFGDGDCDDVNNSADCGKSRHIREKTRLYST